MGTLGLGQRALNLLRGGADLGAALGANLATSAMEHQHWGAASACVAGTALFIAGRNALSAHGEQKTHAQIEKRLLRALQDGQTDLLTAIKTVAAEQDAHAYIRGLLVTLFDADVARKVRIQYGGSVKPANARELMSQPDVDGALVGGASLETRSFGDIVKNSI